MCNFELDKQNNYNIKVFSSNFFLNLIEFHCREENMRKKYIDWTSITMRQEKMSKIIGSRF